jgi:predicted O-linked N-acetylglucosamine transferase (SPINDLY family)
VATSPSAASTGPTRSAPNASPCGRGCSRPCPTPGCWWAPSEAATAERLLAQFAAAGIGPERLDLRPRLPTRDYLALHNEIDLLLDTFPYAGGTTSNHALWMGVPTLTLAGRTLAQRLGAGIMGKGALRLGGGNEDEFVAIAQRAAAHPDELARLRQSLRGRLMHSPT